MVHFIHETNDHRPLALYIQLMWLRRTKRIQPAIRCINLIYINRLK